MIDDKASDFKKKLIKPGRAISTLLKLSTSKLFTISSAISNGFFFNSLASCIAILLAKSP